MKGIDITNPFKQKLVGEQDTFEGKPHPTYFRLKKGEQVKDCHLGSRFRVQFETDAENAYFGRDNYQGRFELWFDGVEYQNYIVTLWNGVCTLTVTPPDNVKIGDVLGYGFRVIDDTLIEPFEGEFDRHVIEPLSQTLAKSGNRQPPAGKNTGNRQVPDALLMPNIVEIRKEGWESAGFDKLSALKIVDSGDHGLDFWVNMDNVYLQSELKTAPKTTDSRLLEARFKYSLALIGLSLYKERDKIAKQSDGISPEELMDQFTRAVAPVLLPMINTLGDLELQEENIAEESD